MTTLDEPRGWSLLQALAQRETDPERLASIIDQMNRLLDAHHWKTDEAFQCDS